MEDLSMLMLKLECAKEQMQSKEKYIQLLEGHILEHAKYKKGEIVHVCTDPYNNNNPTWYDCEILNTFFNDKGLFKYSVCFTADHFEQDFEHAFSSFPEEKLNKEYPWGKDKYNGKN